MNKEKQPLSEESVKILRSIAHDFKEPLRSIRWYTKRAVKELKGTDRDVDIRLLNEFDAQVSNTQESFGEAYNRFKDTRNSEKFRKFVNTKLNKNISDVQRSWSSISEFVLDIDLRSDLLRMSDFPDLMRRVSERYEGLQRYIEVPDRVKLITLGYHNEALRVADDLVSLRSTHRVTSEKLDVQGRVVDRCDQVLLALIMQNLISNSIKYRRVRRSLRISISLGTTSTRKATDLMDIFQMDGLSIAEKDSVVMLHSDNGIGFAEEAAGRIFEPYYRTEKAQDTAGGAGIGLSVVKAAVERLGGQVGARGRMDQGCQFLCVFPRRGRFANLGNARNGSYTRADDTYVDDPRDWIDQGWLF